MNNRLSLSKKLPVDIVLAPEWWYHNEKITFDEDFFFHPLKRVEFEQQMEKVLYDRWGKYGLGKGYKKPKPEIGAVHLAAGFLLSEMLGCKVNYTDSHPPQVVPLNAEILDVNLDEVFNSRAFKKILLLKEELIRKYGYITGDINWGGILNLALDVRGNSIFTDMMVEPDKLKPYFKKLAEVILKFTSFIEKETSTTSISVNRVVEQFNEPVFLHSECTHTMISEEDYENFLLPFDVEWSKLNRPFGIHYCGSDPHRMAEKFAQINQLDFLDVGWGGDINKLRAHLPETFLNIRLSPVEIISSSDEKIRETILNLVKQSENPYLTGVCCINIDEKVN